jgi:hypothetical protein
MWSIFILIFQESDLFSNFNWEQLIFSFPVCGSGHQKNQGKGALKRCSSKNSRVCLVIGYYFIFPGKTNKKEHGDEICV